MRAGSSIPAQGSGRLLTGPLLIIPTGLLLAVATGAFLYVPPEITGRPEHLLFLQGSTDMGGGCLFAALVSLYTTIRPLRHFCARFQNADLPLSLIDRRPVQPYSKPDGPGETALPSDFLIPDGKGRGNRKMTCHLFPR